MNTSHPSDKKRTSFILLWLAASLFYMDQYVFRVILTTLRDPVMKEFSFGITDIAQLTGFLFYSYLLMVLFAGLLIRRFGKLLMLFLALFGNQLAIILTIFSTSYNSLVISEVLFGLSGAFSANVALCYIKEMHTGKRIGYFTSLTFFMGLLGVFIGGWPVEKCSQMSNWRVCIASFSFLNLLIFVLLVLGERQRRKFLPGLINVYEKQEPEIVPPPGWSPYKSKLIWCQNFYVCFQYLANSSFVLVWLGPFTHVEIYQGKNLSVFSTTIVFAGLSAGYLLFGRLIKIQLNKRLMLMTASLIALTVSLIIIPEHKIDVSILFPLLFILGMAMSSYIISTTIIQTHTPKKYISPVLSIHLFCLNLGGVIALTAINYFIKFELYFHGVNNIKAYHHIFWIIPCSFILAFIMAYIMPKNV